MNRHNDDHWTINATFVVLKCDLAVLLETIPILNSTWKSSYVIFSRYIDVDIYIRSSSDIFFFKSEFGRYCIDANYKNVDWFYPFFLCFFVPSLGWIAWISTFECNSNTILDEICCAWNVKDSVVFERTDWKLINT
jgi:hypothetical protein